MLFKFKQKIIFALSDTHGMHRNVSVPAGVDLIIHCGDACNDGNEEQLNDFFEWFSLLSIPHKIFIAGNHDLPFELAPDIAVHLIPDNVIFLDESCTTVDGIRIGAVDAKPWMHTEEDRLYCPDILLSHGAPYGILDNDSGCSILAATAFHYKPDFHLFGHIHSNGDRQTEVRGIKFCNVAWV